MLNDDSPAILELAAAARENWALGHGFRAAGFGTIVEVRTRRKYLAMDEADTYQGERIPGSGTGRFLIDRTTGVVYSIRGYGQRGDRVGTVVDLAEKFRAGTETYRDCGFHTESTKTGVATW